VKLPGNLNHARPIVQIGDGRIVILGKTGGLGGENEVQQRAILASLKVTATVVNPTISR